MSSHFDAARLLSPRGTSADEGAIIRMAQRTRELRAQGRDIVALTLGEPDFDTPLHIREAATRAMNQGFTHYAPVAGLPELREAISEKLRQENGLTYQPTQVVVANGVKQALNNAILSVIGPGDEVIIPAPFWVSYEASVRHAGGTPVVLPATIDQGYKVPAAELAAALNDRTKLLIINSPSNPTGALWSRKELEDVARIVRGHPRLMVISDEIYEYILFDGEVVSFASLPGMLERTITLNGFSKGFAMTGWRLGYAAGPAPVAKAMTSMQSIISAGANAFVQHAAIAALRGPRQDVERMRDAYRARRDKVLGSLGTIAGLRIGPVPATFYAFPDVSRLLGRKAGNNAVNTAEELCDWLLEEHGVATVPGSAFGAPHSIRLSFAASDGVLDTALARLTRAFNMLDQPGY